MIVPIVLFNVGGGGGGERLNFGGGKKNLVGGGYWGGGVGGGGGGGRDFSRLGEIIRFLKGIVQESTQVNLPNLLNS